MRRCQTSGGCSPLADLTQDGVIKLSLGKKRHALIRPV